MTHQALYSVPVRSIVSIKGTRGRYIYTHFEGDIATGSAFLIPAKIPNHPNENDAPMPVPMTLEVQRHGYATL